MYRVVCLKSTGLVPFLGSRKAGYSEVTRSLLDFATIQSTLQGALALSGIGIGIVVPFAFVFLTFVKMKFNFRKL